MSIKALTELDTAAGISKNGDNLVSMSPEEEVIEQ